MVNIFKQKRIKGWWPFIARDENDEMEITVHEGNTTHKLDIITYLLHICFLFLLTNISVRLYLSFRGK